MCLHSFPAREVRCRTQSEGIMPSNNFKWVSDKEWQVFDRSGKIVDVRDGMFPGPYLELTDPEVGSWVYDTRFITVVDHKFVQDVEYNILAPFLQEHDWDLSLMSHVVLSPLEALRMIAEGVARNSITQATFETARDEGNDVMIDQIDFLLSGNVIPLPVRIISEFQRSDRGYVARKPKV